MRTSFCLALVALLAACEATTPTSTPNVAPPPTPKAGSSSATRDVSSFPTAPDGSRGEFSRGAASEALASAASKAKSKCKDAGGPFGTAKVKSTFDPGTGKIFSTNIADGVFMGTAVGECITRTFLEFEIPPFDGKPVSVTKSVTMQ